MFIELPCLLVNRVHENRTCSYNVRRLSDSRQSIVQKRLPQPSTFLVLIDGELCRGLSNTNNGTGSPLPAGTELLYVGDNVGDIHGFTVDPNSGVLKSDSGSPFVNAGGDSL